LNTDGSAPSAVPGGAKVPPAEASPNAERPLLLTRA